MPLTYEEQQAHAREEAGAQRKIAANHAAEAAANAEWDELTRHYWPTDAAVALAAASEKLAAGNLSQSDHDALVVSINQRTRRPDTPEHIAREFERKVADATGKYGTVVDGLTDEQFTRLWESI